MNKLLSLIGIILALAVCGIIGLIFLSCSFRAGTCALESWLL